MPQWAADLGVDLSRVVVQRYTRSVDTMEKMLDTALDIIKNSNQINLWVIDSIGALLPKGDVYDSKDKEKSLEGTNMLHLQRKLGEFYRKANIYIAPDKDYKGCAVVLIGQVYTVPDAHVPLEAVKGGNAVKHWAHLRIMTRRGPRSEWPEQVDLIGVDGKKYKTYPGWAGRFKVEKTRINTNEGKECTLTFMHGKGFDSFNATINAAVGLGLLTRSGAIYSCPLFPDQKWKGREAMVQHFSSHAEDFDKLRLTLSEQLSNTVLEEVIEEV